MPVLILQSNTNTWSRPLAGNVGCQADVETSGRLSETMWKLQELVAGHGRKPGVSARKHVVGPKPVFITLWWAAGPLRQVVNLNAARFSITGRPAKIVWRTPGPRPALLAASPVSMRLILFA